MKKIIIITILCSLSPLISISQTMDKITYYKNGKKDMSISKIDIRELNSQYVNVIIKYTRLFKGVTPIKIQFGIGKEIRITKEKSIILYDGEIVTLSDPNDFINYFEHYNYKLIDDKRTTYDGGHLDKIKGKEENVLRFQYMKKIN